MSSHSKVLCVALLVGPLAAACATDAEGGAALPTACPAAAEPQADPPGELVAVEDFGDDPAGLTMHVHAPAGKTTASAIVLALHGCSQTAEDFARVGWNAVADREGFAVVYAQQSVMNNAARCFRWWEPAETDGGGESRSLASMVEHARAQFGATRAFVTGLSAGGAMTAVMLAAYPELFEAGAIMAGVPYRCASSQFDVLGCMNGRVKTGAEWAALVPKPASPPRVSIWHGTADLTVKPANLVELAKQWTAVNGLGAEPTETTTVGPATHRVHRDPAGVARVESWEIDAMGHGVALDAAKGCGTAGPFALDVGLCAADRAAAFFLATPAAPPAEPPSQPTDPPAQQEDPPPSDDDPCR